MVYIAHFVLSMRDLNIYSNAMLLHHPKQLKDFTLQSFSMAPSCREASKKLGYFLDKKINIVRKLSEGEHYNFWLNECCCYVCVEPRPDEYNISYNIVQL